MSFRPPFWASLLSLTAILFFGMLASWQYQRGQEKADIIARRADRSNAELISVAADGRIPSHGRRIELEGYWLADRQVLMDNQIRQGQVGVHVWTPLRLADSRNLVLVDRGWLPSSPYRDQLPDTGSPEHGRITIRGLWRTLPEAGLSTDDGRCESAAPVWPQRLNYPSLELLECLYQQPVANGLLLLDPDSGEGFLREWSDLGLPPQRHYGYAVQWAALALTALLLYLILNFKRSKA